MGAHEQAKEEIIGFELSFRKLWSDFNRQILKILSIVCTSTTSLTYNLITSWPVCFVLPKSVKFWSPSLGIVRSSFSNSYTIPMCFKSFLKKCVPLSYST